MKKVVVFLCLSLVIGLFFRQSVQAQNRKVDLTLVGLMSDSVFDSSEVDEKPEFPGGMDSLYNFIYARLEKSTYSEEEVQNAKKKVYTVSFVVEKDGSIDFVRVRYYGKSSEDEVYRNAKILRLFKQMPKWKPGKRDGEAVDVYYTIHFGDKFIHYLTRCNLAFVERDEIYISPGYQCGKHVFTQTRILCSTKA